MKNDVGGGGLGELILLSFYAYHSSMKMKAS
jgi:hypothetical protein